MLLKMSRRLRVVLCTEENSPFGHIHYLALTACRNVDVICIINSPVPPGGASPRQPFVSTRDFLKRFYMRLLFEIGTLKFRHFRQLIHRQQPLRLRPRKLNAEVASILAKLNPDILISAGYNKILPKRILDIPKIGCFNFHPSPLPRYAGANPWFWMLRHGEIEGGVTVHWMEPEIDVGDIVIQRTFSIPKGTTYHQLYNHSAYLSAHLVKLLIRFCIQGTVPRSPQNLSARTYFPRDVESDHWIDWAEPASSILNLIRASYPHPGAQAFFQEHKFIVRDALMIANSSNISPGNIYRVDHAGVEIKAGKDAIKIRRVVLSGKETTASQLAKTLGLKAGDLLSMPINNQNVKNSTRKKTVPYPQKFTL